METKHQVHNLIILDESGSMESIKKIIIQGLNEIVQTVKGVEMDFPEQEHFISFVTFNGRGQKLLHFIDPVSKLEQIDDKRYQPDSSTPLYDAMGFSISKLRQNLEDKTDYDVLVTILTDGNENASKEYSGNSIKKMIDELKLLRWTFTYIGTDHDVERFAASISISNSIHFNKNINGWSEMVVSESRMRHKYSQNIRDKKDSNVDLYNNEESTTKSNS